MLASRFTLLHVAPQDSSAAVAPFARLAIDDGARVMAAVEAGAQLLRRVSAETPPRTSDQRRALERRDKGCVVDGFPRDGSLHAHHVVFWREGGTTSLDNLVLLCSFHHRLVHQGVLIVELVDGKPVCLKGDRRPRRARVAPPMDHDGALREMERMGVSVELQSSRADGEQLDWDCAFAALNSLFDRAEAHGAR